MVAIEVYADIWCPFAYVGLETIANERTRLGRSDVELIIHAWPLEWVNGKAQNAESTLANVNEIRRQVAPDHFADFSVATFPITTIPALALIAAGYQQSDATGEKLSFSIREALFEHGRDISATDVLREFADDFHLDPGAIFDDSPVRRDWTEGKLRGVRGSPHFFFGESESFCPVLDIARDTEGHLVLERNAERLREFLEVCFASK